jgi:hypothetical protein
MDRDLIGQTHIQELSILNSQHTLKQYFYGIQLDLYRLGLTRRNFYDWFDEKNHFTFGGHNFFSIYSID